ncbi:hypothetical protein G5I_01859 [Acromyrmex echinatior]|uniref:Uncharacterized protein n=1 Tax=Acromyrmex echinatior TaxID=103372 RepID=F4W8S6_ACREC|nr:hypothetical protein G5I_01859 [Acromyrmex echinatior]
MSAADYMKPYTVCPSEAEEIAEMAKCRNHTSVTRFGRMCKTLQATELNGRRRTARRSLRRLLHPCFRLFFVDAIGLRYSCSQSRYLCLDPRARRRSAIVCNRFLELDNLTEIAMLDAFLNADVIESTQIMIADRGPLHTFSIHVEVTGMIMLIYRRDHNTTSSCLPRSNSIDSVAEWGLTGVGTIGSNNITVGSMYSLLEHPPPRRSPSPLLGARNDTLSIVSPNIGRRVKGYRTVVAKPRLLVIIYNAEDYQTVKRETWGGIHSW